MAVRARLTLDFRGVLAEIGRPTVEIALGRPTHQHEGAVAEDGIIKRLHERNISILAWDVLVGTNSSIASSNGSKSSSDSFAIKADIACTPGNIRKVPNGGTTKKALLASQSGGSLKFSL